MKFSLLLAFLLSFSTILMAEESMDEAQTFDDATAVSSSTLSNTPCECSRERVKPKAGCVCDTDVLNVNKTMRISVIGQGVAPTDTDSPAQAYALAKRAAIADAYRLVAEKVKGVRVNGQDLIKNMMVKRTTVRTAVQAMVRNATVVETSFKNGLCEVEMELVISYAQFL